MTLEDFVESVVAGWVPIAWHPLAVHLVALWRWVVIHVTPWALAILAARRK